MQLTTMLTIPSSPRREIVIGKLRGIVHPPSSPIRIIRRAGRTHAIRAYRLGTLRAAARSRRRQWLQPPGRAITLNGILSTMLIMIKVQRRIRIGTMQSNPKRILPQSLTRGSREEDVNARLALPWIDGGGGSPSFVAAAAAGGAGAARGGGSSARAGGGATVGDFLLFVDAAVVEDVLEGVVFVGGGGGFGGGRLMGVAVVGVAVVVIRETRWSHRSRSRRSRKTTPRPWMRSHGSAGSTVISLPSSAHAATTIIVFDDIHARQGLSEGANHIVLLHASIGIHHIIDSSTTVFVVMGSCKLY
mmetsp:Transcript_24027/g.43098  ORF Transcript_24027/g.43098 Transcript_24027/m.43098 type:complete len:303 (-) Transcript_24027:232-1140(-)